MNTDNDYAAFPCPRCHQMGTTRYDSIINKYKCGACGNMGFDPNVPATITASPVPIVIDYLIDPNSKIRSMIEVACPKDNPPPLDFDPHSASSKFIKKRLAPLVAKEKRYRRDKLKAHGQQPVDILAEVRELVN